MWRLLKFIFSILVFIMLAGCAHSAKIGAPEREPATLPISPGGLNNEETRICEDLECKYFIAPCSLKEHSPLYRAPGSTEKPAYLSLKEEQYLTELDTLYQRGFCQLAPRALPAEQYNHDTCIYV